MAADDQTIGFTVKENFLEKFKFAGAKLKSLLAREMNKEITSGRKQIVEYLMQKTLLKRKMLNDRIIISRASPDNLHARITPIFSNDRMMFEYYPNTKTASQSNKSQVTVKSKSPIYTKTLKPTHFVRDDKIFFRDGGKIFRPRGKTTVGLFDKFAIQNLFGAKIVDNIQLKIDGFFSNEI